MQKKAVKKTSPATSPAVKDPTEAEKIWNEIKDRSIDLFALPGQVVSGYCKPLNVEPSKCYLTITASSVLPALEIALQPTPHEERAAKASKSAPKLYDIERNDKFIIVSRKKAF